MSTQGGPPGRGTPLLSKAGASGGGASGSSPQPLSGAGSSRTGPQFDLEPNAFPPLPGMDSAAASAATAKASATPEASTHLPDASPAQSHWENR